MPPNGYTQMPYPDGKPPRHINFLLLPMIIAVLAFFAALGFAIWAYGGMQDYKNNVDKKVEAAVEVAKQEISVEKDKEFAEKEKSPFRKYTGPETYGSVSFQYPKTWSAFITEQGTGNNVIDGYLHPNFVPGLQSGTAMALRFQISNQPYATEAKSYESQGANGKFQITPYRAAKVSNVLGIRVVGAVKQGQKDTLIVLPLRDKTLKIWTESEQFVSDLDNTIMASLTFVP